MAERDERLTGIEATRRVLATADREEFVTIALVARALGRGTRVVLRDWVKSRKFPVTRVGRGVMLSSALVVMTYFPHRQRQNPATGGRS